VAAGTSIITYALSTGCRATAIVTVNPIPAAIFVPSALCVGATITVSDVTPGGTWSSGTPAIGSVDAGAGVVTGISAGTAMITYTLPTTCFTTATVNVSGAGAVTVNGGGVFCGSTTITASGGTGGVIYFQGNISGGTSTSTPSTSQVIS